MLELAENVVSKQMFRPLFTGFKTPKSRDTKISQVVLKLERKKKLHFVGRYRKKGRPLNLYATWKCPVPEHDFELSQILEAMAWPTALRGPKVDKELLPDAELFIGNNRYLMEMDTGTMTQKKVRARWKKLARSTDVVLVITSSQRRRKSLQSWSTLLRDRILIAVHEELKSTPWGPVWLDIEGGQHAIKRC